MAPWAHGDVRSLAVEREWDGWDDFFKSGSLMLAAVSSSVHSTSSWIISFFLLYDLIVFSSSIDHRLTLQIKYRNTK